MQIFIVLSRSCGKNSANNQSMGLIPTELNGLLTCTKTTFLSLPALPIRGSSSSLLQKKFNPTLVYYDPADSMLIPVHSATWINGDISFPITKLWTPANAHTAYQHYRGILYFVLYADILIGSILPRAFWQLIIQRYHCKSRVFFLDHWKSRIIIEL